MMRQKRLFLALIIISYLSYSIAFAQAPKHGLHVEHVNQILSVYLDQKLKEDCITLVFEFKNMKFYSNQRMYGCIFVNGRIVQTNAHHSRR